MKLNPISVSNLNYLDSGQFIVRFLTDYGALGLQPDADPDFKTLYDDLKNQSPIYNEAVMQIRAQTESEALFALDEIRDKRIGALRIAHSVYKHTDNAKEMAAYNEIKIVLNKYKDIEKANYEAESVAIDNMLLELQKENRLSFLKTLRLINFAEKLYLANVNFKEKFNNRSIQNITKTVYDTKMLRKEILISYNELTEYVLVMAKRKNTPYYLDTLNVINNGRDYFATIIAHHKSVRSLPDTK